MKEGMNCRYLQAFYFGGFVLPVGMIACLFIVVIVMATVAFVYLCSIWLLITTRALL